MVDRLAMQYECDVNYRRIKDGGTALHAAAYYGHADVVATLLNSGLISDLTIKNKSEGKTALDCARAGQEAYDKKELRGNNVSIKGPKSLVAKSSCIDFTKRNGWPGWGNIIPLLEAARVDKTQ
jgi:ankyrin repeat protein